MVTAAELPRGLVYIRDTEPGFKRKKRGKGVTFLDSHNEKLTNEADLERIENLVIPPAWKDVWISPKSNGYLQATGIDEKGRKQYLYHEKWSAHSQKLKYEDLLRFGFYLPKLRRRYQQDLKQRKWNRKKVLALATALMDELYLRVGNRQYTTTNHTHGLTTLRRKHLKESNGKLFIEFIGKSGKNRSLTLTDKRLIRLLTNCSQLPGYELFRYEEDGKWHTLDSSSLNEYISEEAEEGEYYTAKYFRTWGANSLCIKYKQDANEQCQGTRKKPETTLIKIVAAEMGHTVAVCKSSYLHPDILSYCISAKEAVNCLPDDLDTSLYKPSEIEMMGILCKKLLK